MTGTRNSAGRIDRMEVFRVPIRVRSVRAHGIGAVSDAIEVVVLRLQTDAGLVGWGEASPWAVFTGTAEANAAALDRYLRPIVMGADPAETPRIMALADRSVAGNTDAKAALETALLDLSGQAAGAPIWALLGGKCRDSIPLSVSIADPDWSKDRDLIAQITGDGIGIVKLKAGFADHGFDLMRIEEIRRDWPDLRIRLDYNQGMVPIEAMRRLRDMDTLGLDFIEQPVPARQWEAMAELRAATDTPLLADESIFGPEDMIRAVPARIADGVSIKIMKSGGLRAGVAIARIAAAAGWGAYGGDMFETGIAHLAGTHMIAAAPEIDLGCEFYHARYHLEQDLLAAPFPLENGQVVIPDSPGLGAEVDEARIRAMAI